MTTIEVGKCYRDRQGRKIEVLAIRDYQVFGITKPENFPEPFESYEARLDFAQEYWTLWVDEPAIPWDSVPEWCQWWAVDKDGAQAFYEGKPILTQNEFMVSGVDGYIVVPKSHRIPYTGDWKESLRQRPGKEVA